MSGRRLALYAVCAVLAYLVALLALAPAAWLAQSIERASRERLELRDATGSAWSGSGRLYARTRAVDATHGTLVNYRALDAISCILLHDTDPDILGVAGDCLSHRSETYVYTEDYEHGSPGCNTVPGAVANHYNATAIPATMLIMVMMRPATASPLTNFMAPSMPPCSALSSASVARFGRA